MSGVIERMAEALNRHDLEAFVECFDPSYRSEQPAHPNRGFGGKAQVRKNWSGMFESFPDFEARLLRHTGANDEMGDDEQHRPFKSIGAISRDFSGSGCAGAGLGSDGKSSNSRLPGV